LGVVNRSPQRVQSGGQLARLARSQKASALTRCVTVRRALLRQIQLSAAVRLLDRTPDSRQRKPS
jgi:hypothetical protein